LRLLLEDEQLMPVKRIGNKFEVRISEVVQIDSVNLCAEVHTTCLLVRNRHRAPGRFIGMWEDVLLFLRRDTNSYILLLSDCGSDDHGS
jgi:hypothetical protein